jgi:hypothetical protein
MASTYLDGLMNEIERLEGEIEKANKKLIHTKNFIEKLIEV